jgi:hypothetical protein
MLFSSTFRYFYSISVLSDQTPNPLNAGGIDGDDSHPHVHPVKQIHPVESGQARD